MVKLREPTPTVDDAANKSGVFFDPPTLKARPMRREWYHGAPKNDTDHHHATFRHAPSATAFVTGQLRDILRANMMMKPKYDEESEDRLEAKDRESLVPNIAEESNQIGTVRKERVFESEVTESDMDIITKRMALQQRQFAEFERREFNRKARKIRNMYDHLSDEEIKFALEQFRNNEEEVIGQFSCPGYLFSVRKELARVSVQPMQATLMSDEQRAAYEQLLRKRTSTLKKSTTDDARRKYRTCKRLTLDDALKQLQQNKIDPAKAMEGWSAARIKAYQAIDTKPNTYYYRFNAPGEEQRTGAWTDEEKRLFHKRLAELGADGQWGIFSMAVPGRVGYQCSNYYRHLIETRQLHDPNYVLDDRGKAHYLFTTKQVNKDGSAVKTFRTHKKKHTYGGSGGGAGDSGDEESDQRGSATEAGSGNLSANEGGGDPTKRRAGRTGRTRATRVGGILLNNASTTGGGPGTPGGDGSGSGPLGGAASALASASTTAAVGSAAKRKRRAYGKYDSDEDDEDQLAHQDDSSDEDFMASAKSANQWNTTKRTRMLPNGGSGVPGPAQGQGGAGSSSDVDRAGSVHTRTAAHSTTTSAETTGLSFMALMTRGIQGLNSMELAELMEDDDDQLDDPENPLPGFTDPITLEPVVKPAISPYGHVMGYENWVRCLTSEGGRNICPLTKKPCSKRDLVVLTHDNIEEYRDKIVNL
ncbi:hypothetical protein H4R33_005328 [Dimargaris cristalligena]|nr:hypothetical protein H4R33_005328 [Dimargaris cristalligena]